MPVHASIFFTIHLKSFEYWVCFCSLSPAGGRGGIAYLDLTRKQHEPAGMCELLFNFVRIAHVENHRIAPCALRRGEPWIMFREITKQAGDRALQSTER